MNNIPLKLEKLYNKAMKAIKEDGRIVFFQDIIKVLGISKSSFYKYFPKEGNMYKEIDEALENNRSATKLEIRDRLYNLKNPTALIALYRLLGTIEEKNALVMKEVEDKEAKDEKHIKVVVN